MKFSNLFRLLIAVIFLSLFPIAAAAQDSGAGFDSYTSIDYDEATNMVTAYSETDAGYELQGDYEAIVLLTVINDSGAVVASGSQHDYWSGFAAVQLDFAGEAGRTYTATGTHHAYLSLSDYSMNYPYQPFYYDNWYMTGYEGQNIYQPWSYYFGSPGYRTYTRRTRGINLGRTYDSVSTQNFDFRGSIQAQGPDISYGNKTVDLGAGVKGNKNTISWKWAQNTALTAAEGISALNSIKSKLTSTQSNNRTSAFSCANRYITGCAAGHGCVPTVNSGGKICEGNNGTHVDVVIYKGLNFQN